MRNMTNNSDDIKYIVDMLVYQSRTYVRTAVCLYGVIETLYDNDDIEQFRHKIKTMIGYKKRLVRICRQLEKTISTLYNILGDM